MPDPETSTTRRLATGLAATVGPFLGELFVRSYECFGPPDTGKPTKRPTVSNDTGTPEGPHGTGAGPAGSVWGELVRDVRGTHWVHRAFHGYRTGYRTLRTAGPPDQS
ncbi:hypothetical protein GCM10023336_34620 [Streptomyces similanensis]|uniref:Uncharacterized protein n=1 Tax=Streptomyces similanensis TaxID=1274988 RepID=A0ABP9KKF1_9ACTN